MKKNTGTGLMKAVAQLLELRGYDVLRFNCGAAIMPGKGGGRGRFVRFGPPGMSDLMALGDDCTLWIEVKSPGQSLNANQRAFADRVQARGHIYLCVRSLEEMVTALEALDT